MIAAQLIASLIRRNVDNWYANRISFETFGKRQEKLWRKAERLRVADEVTELVRPKFCATAMTNDNGG